MRLVIKQLLVLVDNKNVKSNLNITIIKVINKKYYTKFLMIISSLEWKKESCLFYTFM